MTRLPFIKFGDYKNQEQWAAVSQSINEDRGQGCCRPAEAGIPAGKTISFVGAFTVSSGSSDVLITPVVLEAK